MNLIFRGLSRRICIWLFLTMVAAGRVWAQSVTDSAAAATNSTEEQIAALQLQLTNAWHQVETIVNQPVPAYRMDSSYSVSVFSPGWFHPGASIPDFNNVDVRRSQELIYTATWVSSDITPTMMFHGKDLEFNAMTKLFYTNRTLPKKKLTEAEMVQINAFYRTIGHCQTEISGLQPPAPVAEAAADTESGTNEVASAGALGTIEHMPRQTRILYGGIAIGSLLVLVIVLRLFGKKAS